LDEQVKARRMRERQRFVASCATTRGFAEPTSAVFKMAFLEKEEIVSTRGRERQMATAPMRTPVIWPR